MKNCFFDLETFSREPIKNGTHRYAEGAEVMLWAFADGDGNIYVWDLVNCSLHWCDELSGVWVESTPYGIPHDLERMLQDPEYLVVGHNAGMFDFVVLHHAQPWFDEMVSLSRRRDTMVQAFCHGLPGALDKLGVALNIDEAKRKDTEGKKYIHLFCKPQSEAFIKKYGTDRATKQTHPEEWAGFIRYAGRDITVMREAHRKMPKWNYTGRQVELWHIDLTINQRGFKVDQELATAAVAAVAEAREVLNRRTVEVTDGVVEAATQRDKLLEWILASHGVELPDMQADTLERRLGDPDLPTAVRELIGIRLQASMNSVSKYRTLLRAVSSDGRLRGGAQFRGAFRTGRWAHRLFQHGNMPRMDIEAIARWWGLLKSQIKDAHVKAYIDLGVEAFKAGTAELTHGDVVRLASCTIRSTIVAEEGRKLVVDDLSNIEGRIAAWLAGEDGLLQAFRDFDAGTGPDLYKLSYARSFNVDPATVSKDDRQIGKVQSLFLQYQGGVGAFLTGAATYGIDLTALGEAAWPTLPTDVIEAAESFRGWIVHTALLSLFRKLGLVDKKSKTVTEEQYQAALEAADPVLVAEAQAKVQFGLTDKVFVVCDSLKRMWRRTHPQISSYWKELEDAAKAAVLNPGKLFVARKLKFRRDGAWLRMGLPSGRVLCYPNPDVSKKDGTLNYMGLNQYSRKWERLSTYGGKLCIAAGTLVLTESRSWVSIEDITSVDKVWDGVSWVCTGGAVCTGLQPTVLAFGIAMTPDHEVLVEQGWVHASQSGGHIRAACRLPDGVEVPQQRRQKVAVGGGVRMRCGETAAGFRNEEAEDQRRSCFVRLHEERDCRGEEHQARNVEAPGVLGVAEHGGPVPPSDAPRLAQLRGQRDLGLQTVVGLQELLGGHVPNVQSRVDSGEGEERQGIQQAQLRVGYTSPAVPEQKDQPVLRHPVGEVDGSGSCGCLRREKDNDVLPVEPWVADAQSVRVVYDLMDCGPLHRFTVWADGAPLIVHNCENAVQAVAADQLSGCMPAIEAAGYPIVFHVHDEIVCETPDTGDFTAEALAGMMCADLGWNQGLPLSAAGFETYRYRKE